MAVTVAEALRDALALVDPGAGEPGGGQHRAGGRGGGGRRAGARGRGDRDGGDVTQSAKISPPNTARAGTARPSVARWRRDRARGALPVPRAHAGQGPGWGSRGRHRLDAGEDQEIGRLRPLCRGGGPAAAACATAMAERFAPAGDCSPSATADPRRTPLRWPAVRRPGPVSAPASDSLTDDVATLTALATTSASSRCSPAAFAAAARPGTSRGLSTSGSSATSCAASRPPASAAAHRRPGRVLGRPDGQAAARARSTTCWSWRRRRCTASRRPRP